MAQLPWKMEWWVLKKAEHRSPPWNVAFLLIGMYLKELKIRELSRYLHTLVIRSLIRSSQRLEQPKSLLMDEWING